MKHLNIHMKEGKGTGHYFDELAFLTPPFLGGFLAEVCEIHAIHITATFYNFFDE